MHSFTLLRRNTVSPSTAVPISADAPGSKDPHALLLELERSIACLELARANAELAALSKCSESQPAQPRARGAGTSNGTAIGSKPQAPLPAANGASAGAREEDGGTRADAAEEKKIGGILELERRRSDAAEEKKIGEIQELENSAQERARPSVSGGQPRAQIAWTAADVLGAGRGSGVEVIHRRRSSSKGKPTTDSTSRPVASGPALENGRVGQGQGQVRNHDKSLADREFAAGISDLAGQMPEQALKHLRVALSACPPEEQVAVRKIQRMIEGAEDLLRKTESGTRGATKSLVQVGSFTPTARQAVRQGGFQVQPPMKILQVGDMEAADNAFRAGVAALEKGEPAKALECLEKAARFCPPDRTAASSKIQLLVSQALFELRQG